MTGNSNNKTKIASEVQFAVRSSGQKHFIYYIVDGTTANRWLRKLNRHKKHGYAHFDTVEIKGLFEPAVALKAGRATMLNAEATTFLRKKQEQRLIDSDFTEAAEQRRKQAGRWRAKTQFMSFHGDTLDQTAIVFCTVTGLVGKLEMPYCPVAFSFEHPLAKAGNALAAIKYFKEHKWNGAERQLLAGLLLSLLTAKRLLPLEAGESTASERNLVLQNAGSDTLQQLLWYFHYYWDNAAVWKRIPRLNLEWKTHASGYSTVRQTLNSYLHVLQTVFDPQDLTQAELGKIYAAQSAIKPKQRIKVYSAAAVQIRQIKEAKTEAHELFEALKPNLGVVEKLTLTRVIKDLLLLPQSTKDKAASMLRQAQLRLGNKPAASLAGKLAVVIAAAQSEKVFEDLSTLSQETLKVPVKSIAEILEAKRAKQQYVAEAKEESNGN